MKSLKIDAIELSKIWSNGFCHSPVDICASALAGVCRSEHKNRPGNDKNRSAILDWNQDKPPWRWPVYIMAALQYEW